MSRNSPDLSLCAFKSIEDFGLTIKLGSFTSGRPLAPFIPAWRLDLFLSNDTSDVQMAGTAAARLVAPPNSNDLDDKDDEVRIAFDGDAVVFSQESDLISSYWFFTHFYSFIYYLKSKPGQCCCPGNFLNRFITS